MSEIDFEESSGNVFADMGLDNADELQVRSELGFQVRKILESRGYTQSESAEILEVKQPEISNLMRGKYHLFSEGRLMGFLNKLDCKVVIQVSRHHGDEPFQQVSMTL